MGRTVVVLAAGEGTRMKSPACPRCCTPLAGRTLLGHVLAATAPLHAERTVVVVGHGATRSREHLGAVAPGRACRRAGAAERHRARRPGGARGRTRGVDGTVVVLPGTRRC